MPTDPVPAGAVSTATGYVSSAVSWVAGSILGGKDGAKDGAKDSAKPAEQARQASASGTAGASEPPKSVSSKDVNRVLPAMAMAELSMEELEALGTKPAQPEPKGLEHADSVEDMWGENAPAKKADAWSDGEWSDVEKAAEASNAEKAETSEIAAAGGWGDTELGFSDEEDEKAKKEDATLAMIKEMAKQKNEPAACGRGVAA